jgi:hypothetical protein
VRTTPFLFLSIFHLSIFPFSMTFHDFPPLSSAFLGLIGHRDNNQINQINQINQNTKTTKSTK